MSERFTIRDFHHKSDLKDGDFHGKLKIFRWTPSIEANIVTAKASMLSGNRAASQRDHDFVLAVCTVMNGMERIDTAPPDWVGEIIDRDCIFALYRQYVEYQDSFKKAAVEAVNADAQAHANSPKG